MAVRRRSFPAIRPWRTITSYGGAPVDSDLETDQLNEFANQSVRGCVC